MTLDQRLTRIEEQVTAMRGEVTLLRERWHNMESDRAAVRNLSEAIKNMPERISQIAREAVTETLAAKGTQRVQFIGVWAQIISVMVGVAGLTAAIVTAAVR